MFQRRRWPDRKSTRLNSSHTEIYTLSLHDALPICPAAPASVATSPVIRVSSRPRRAATTATNVPAASVARSEEHTSELQSHRDLHSFPTRRSSDLSGRASVGGYLTSDQGFFQATKGSYDRNEYSSGVGG